MGVAKQQSENCSISNVSFARGITGEDPILKEDKPHLVFAGRSNAGKSSVINTVVGQEVARVSSQPGKTTEINFYEVEGQAYLVDLPGYGYAKMSAKRADKVRKQMIWYLARSAAPILHVFLVIDIRRGLQDFDQQLLDITAGEGLPTTIIANKVDKCNQSELAENRQQLERQVTDREDVAPGMLEFSAQDRTGKDTLCELIKSIYAN